MELSRTAAIISGGASGLGEAAARELATAGSAVVIADLNEEAGKQIAGECAGRQLDVRTRDEHGGDGGDPDAEPGQSRQPSTLPVCDHGGEDNLRRYERRCRRD